MKLLNAETVLKLERIDNQIDEITEYAKLVIGDSGSDFVIAIFSNSPRGGYVYSNIPDQELRLLKEAVDRLENP